MNRLLRKGLPLLSVFGIAACGATENDGGTQQLAATIATSVVGCRAFRFEAGDGTTTDGWPPFLRYWEGKRARVAIAAWQMPDTIIGVVWSLEPASQLNRFVPGIAEPIGSLGPGPADSIEFSFGPNAMERITVRLGSSMNRLEGSMTFMSTDVISHDTLAAIVRLIPTECGDETRVLALHDSWIRRLTGVPLHGDPAATRMPPIRSSTPAEDSLTRLAMDSLAWERARRLVQRGEAIFLAATERDLTGDGVLEWLRVTGTGPSIDSLDATFTIVSSGRTVFETTLHPITRTMGYDAGRRELSASEHKARVDEFGDWFFSAEKFMRPAEFVDELRRSAAAHVSQIPVVIGRDRRYQFAVDSLVGAGHSLEEAERSMPALRIRSAPLDTTETVAIWEEIQRTGVTVFQFSPGGDALTAIAWSARDQRFYRLLECC